MNRIQLSFIGAVVYSALLTGPSVMAQTQATPQLTALPAANTYQITWPGTAGRLYFIQFSTDLQTWTYAPTVSLGSGVNIAYGFASTTARTYARLKYSVATNITAGATGDFDGDGINNYDEVAFFGTDPTVSDDTDQDGYINADEVANGTSPTNAASKPFDPLSPPPAQWYVGTMDSYWTKFQIDPVEIAQNRPAQVAVEIARATAMADGSFDLPFLTIQPAINAAAAGDVIQIAPGTYAGGLNLTARNVKLIGMPGQREATIINGGNIGLDFGAANTSATVVSGITIQGTAAQAMRFQNGAAPIIANCVINGCNTGLNANNSSPRVFNTVINASTNAVAGSGVLAANGGTVSLTHCTVIDNPRPAAQGQVRATGAATIALRNSIVRSDGIGNPGQDLVGAGGAVTAVFSNIAQAQAGTGNINVAPQFDAAFPTERRLLRLSAGVDQADANGLPGYRFLTRRDYDGEQRGVAYNVQGAVGMADMGADEFVSRLTFATLQRNLNGAVVNLSEVDEASDVAFLGNIPGTGDARIAIVNDETIEEVIPGLPNVSHNEITLFSISANTGDITGRQRGDLRRGAGSANEIKDAEAVTFDPANGRLWVATSQAKANKYRDCEGTIMDPLVDAPSNDYDPRRCAVVLYNVDNNLLLPLPAPPAPQIPVPAFYYDGSDGIWAAVAANRRDMDAFSRGITNNSPVGWDSQTGLVANIRASIQGNGALPALQASNQFNAGVLIAWSTSPKFGTPVNGTQYPVGAAIPYQGLGGPNATGGTSLGNQVAPPGNAGIVHGGRVANTTYFYQAWGFDAAFNYSRPLAAQAITNGNPPLLVNEIEGAGADFIEVFNASGVQVNAGLMRVLDDGGNGGNNVPFAIQANTQIPARNWLTLGPAPLGPLGFNIGGGSDDGQILGPVPNGVFTRYGQFTRDQVNQANGGAFWNGLPNAEGRVWDGGPRGLKWDTANARLEAEGAIYRSSAGSPQIITQGQTNHAAGYKFFQASADANQNTVYLHYANMGVVPGVWASSPKDQDFHAINVEAMAYRNPQELIVGLRAPLSNRATGNALYYVVNNVANFLPAANNWVVNNAANNVGAVQQINLNGQGFRSIEWIPILNAYLIIGGPANGGPLKNETGREVFTLYQWAGPGNQPVVRIANLRPFTERPEGVNVITLTVNNQPVQRLLFVEDRAKSAGYGTRNAVHWPMTIMQ